MDVLYFTASITDPLIKEKLYKIDWFCFSSNPLQQSSYSSKLKKKNTTVLQYSVFYVNTDTPVYT